jgi:hypothetical protein
MFFRSWKPCVERLLRRPGLYMEQGLTKNAVGSERLLVATTTAYRLRTNRGHRRTATLQLLLLELNEVNFGHLRYYTSQGRVRHLGQLIERHGVIETTSEREYHELEPWIQWVTAHTGLPLADHRVFRLGDIESHELVQIWEVLEESGLRVGAMSPMNAKNRTREAGFFVPDPWTSTRLTAPRVLRGMYRAISQVVNDNAKARVSLASVFLLLLGAARYMAPVNYSTYARAVVSAPRKPWVKAMFLDLLLADTFIAEVRRVKPAFASLFLNAAAHIQHHYMFNSVAYQGGLRNPEWYVQRDMDPVGEIYELYDRIVGQVLRSFPDARVMIATGLHQDPHPEVTFYWRLKDHESFLRKIGVPFVRVDTLMSRDFIVECSDAGQALRAQRVLASAKASTGEPLFEVDNRGDDLFVMLTWPNDVSADFSYTVDGTLVEGFRDDVAFVAIKNGQHNGVGYFVDTGLPRSEAGPGFPLRELPMRICRALGVTWTGGQSGDRLADENARITS